ncbi:MAG: hypothetical protein WCI21_01830 [Alphaproteobacteria bacterium]
MKVLALAAAATLLAGAVLAQTPPAPAPAAAAAPKAPAAPLVARGTVTSLDGTTLVIKSDAGPSQTIQLASAWAVSVLKPVPVTSIQPGSFIGTTEIPQPDGKGKSVEVHVFAPGIKLGEGHYAWDLRPDTMMTNGTVGTVKQATGGRELEVTYGASGTRTVTVPGDAPVNLITDGTRDQIKPGVPVFMTLRRAADGTLGASSIMIGENGAKPPM